MKKLILINILVVILIILTGEMLLRVFSNITVHGLDKGIINYENKPIFNLPNISNKKAFGKKIYTDSNGFRIQKKNDQKKKDKNNIYFVGGSVTFGKGVKQENTFTGILDKEIQDYNIVNAGVVGSNLENNIEVIRKKINKDNLKSIFINYSLDDLANIDTIIKFEDKNANKKDTLYEKLKNNKFVIYLNKLIRTKSTIYITLKGYIFDTEKVFYQQALNFYKVDNNLKMLKKLIGTISKFEPNNKIVFIMIPYSHQVNVENCSKDDLAEKEIVKTITNNNIKLIRFKEFFCKDENREKIFFKYDPAHLSKYGHKLVAKILKQKIN
tara:strand:+ start:2102 stop:3079 length:978 start_codon:yes stop_codon:yes gene_type:complete